MYNAVVVLFLASEPASKGIIDGGNRRGPCVVVVFGDVFHLHALK
jgi:hypothetical protein